MIAEHIRSGRLIELGRQSLVTGFGYYIGLPKYRTVSPAVHDLHERLIHASIKDRVQ